jgi:quercetin dioxygenase-like cupin family protein
MQRREFITTTLLALPALAYSPSWLAASSSKAFVVKAGASRFGVPTPFYGVNPNDLKLSSKDTDGRLSAFDYAGVQRVGPSLHAHAAQDEMFYVVDGTYVFQLGTEKQQLQAGDVIFLPRNIPHTWIQMSDKGQMFYFLQPAGKMEEYFLKVSQTEGKATDAERAQMRRDHGIQNFGPGLSASDQHVLSDSLSQGFIVRAGRGRFGETTMLGGVSPNDIKVSATDTGGELSIFEYQGRERGGPPLHVHPNQDEVFYVSQGTYQFQCGDDRFDLQKGDMIFLPRGVPHAFAQLTEAGRMVCFFQPSGKMEDFFRAIGRPGALATPEDGARTFAAHDMQVVGPPLPYAIR